VITDTTLDFVDERRELVFDAFGYFEPVKTAYKIGVV